MAVYRCANLDARRDTPPAARARFRGWRALFPMKPTQDLLRAAYARVDRLNTPPAGEPFYLDGKPYATEIEFVDDLVEEFRAQLLRYLAGGQPVAGDQPAPQSRPAAAAVPGVDVGRALALALVKGGAAQQAH